MKKDERKEVFDKMYSLLQVISLSIQDYKIHSCFVSGEMFAKECLDKIDRNADMIKDCVKRLRGDSK